MPRTRFSTPLDADRHVALATREIGMPCYDLGCSACGWTGEVNQKMDARQPTRCPKCGQRKAHRMIVKPPAFRNTYSPMHPRRNRGRGY